MSKPRYTPQPFGRLMTIHMVVVRVVRIPSSLKGSFHYRLRERRAEKGRYYMPWPHLSGDPYFERDLTDGLTYGVPLHNSPPWGDDKHDEIRFRRMHWGGVGMVIGNVMKHEGVITPERGAYNAHMGEYDADPGYMDVASTHRLVELACPPTGGAAHIVLAAPYDLAPYNSPWSPTITPLVTMPVA